MGILERHKIDSTKLWRLTFQSYSFSLKPDDTRLITRLGFTTLKKIFNYGQHVCLQGHPIYVLEYHNGYRIDKLTDEMQDVGMNCKRLLKNTIMMI